MGAPVAIRTFPAYDDFYRLSWRCPRAYEVAVHPLCQGGTSHASTARHWVSLLKHTFGPGPGVRIFISFLGRSSVALLDSRAWRAL